ncbi:conserved hypothetical protein [Streptomyces viridosporus ATCC 14672]|uniref:Uncharacterized protein n=1 Tax=Streptomyces viridosporus (strain ATCC 14672 / DSM 40746 / JCM 4963 / KCTC 9882 / NRRL B-12104 / FH 1290) TaxID=566461 RepID=D6A201_STRV1|nr:conserved hypothetical protein [Streptomyces viridosporus ATCC 14672]
MSERQLGLLDAREETGDVFDERERAAPALTEAVTVLTGGAPPRPSAPGEASCPTRSTHGPRSTSTASGSPV